MKRAATIAAACKECDPAAGEEVRFIFMLGEGRRDEGRRIRAKYADHGAVDAAREELKNFWEEKCSKLQVQTPNDGMNALLNTWTLYQS